MQHYVMNRSLLERYFAHFAEKLADAPGAACLAQLAATAMAVPESSLADLTACMAVLDPAIVSSVLAVRAREIGAGELYCDDASAFVRALTGELQVYIDQAEFTAMALAEMQQQERGRMH